jgi:hypothetical protein
MKDIFVIGEYINIVLVVLKIILTMRWWFEGVCILFPKTFVLSSFFILNTKILTKNA